jgi:hypothetical protein
MNFQRMVHQLETRVTSTIAFFCCSTLWVRYLRLELLLISSRSILVFFPTRPSFTQLYTPRHSTFEMYAIAKRVPYAAHVIVLFTFAFSAFVLV